MLTILINLLLTLHVIVSILIVLVVLMQRPKSEGLGAAFGGGMTENLFGAQTTNVLANFTRWLAGIFFLLTLLLSILYAKQSTQKSAIQEQLLKTAPAAVIPATTPVVTGTAAESPSPSPASEAAVAPAAMSPSPAEAAASPATAGSDAVSQGEEAASPAPAPLETPAEEAMPAATPEEAVSPSPSPTPAASPSPSPSPRARQTPVRSR